MNKKKSILAFGASSSRNSINKRFASFAAGRIDHSETTILDLNDFEMPIYSIDKEKENGFPDLAYAFKKHIKECDAIIISFAEHNGAYSAAFKNIFDWISRIEKNVWEDKAMLLLSTSPGARGASTVLEMAFEKFKRMNSNTIIKFSLPSFNDHFSNESGILNAELSDNFNNQMSLFIDSI